MLAMFLVGCVILPKAYHVQFARVSHSVFCFGFCIVVVVGRTVLYMCIEYHI